MSSKKGTIIKRKNIPLKIVKRAKRCKVTYVKAQARDANEDIKSDEQFVDESCGTIADQSLNDSSVFKAIEETFDELNEQQPSSSHTKRKQQASERWEVLQSNVLSTVIATMAKPQLHCATCNESAGVVKCHNCGPLTFYCESCAITMHQNALFHHYLEIWKVRA